MSLGRRIVICGGGAIGAAIAYFTSRRGAQSIIIECHAVAGAASGKSGGFLALDWCHGSWLDALAARWLPLPAVFGVKGHSLVFETGGSIPAEALFLEYREASGEILTPELFPRADGTTWVCAISSLGPLPVDPAEVAPDEGAHARLEALCRKISPALAAAPIKARQACFRPVTEDGLPLIGALPDIDGAYVATGHSVWGMLNAPATGEAMSELILDGASARVDLAPFAPGRFPPLDPARLSGAQG